MSKDETAVSFLEGLGYTAAVMVGAAGLTEQEALRIFNVTGLVFGLIAVVRLLAINIRMRSLGQLSSEDSLPQPRPGRAGKEACDEEQAE